MNETKSSVKALKKQMAAAIAMVTVAAVALGSSTYAWFVQANKVTAQGMNVQAVTEGGIEISYAETDKWASIANSTADKASLYPTSTNNGTTWIHAMAEKSSAKDAVGDSYENLNLAADKNGFNDEGSKQYYSVTDFTIRSTAGTTASNLKISGVSVEGKDKTTELDKSLRVGVSVNNAFYIFAPCDGDTSYNIWSSGTTPTTSVTANTGDTEVATTMSSITNSGVPVKIYIWYEGEDSHHFSNNVTTPIDELSVTVEFSATLPNA